MNILSVNSFRFSNPQLTNNSKTQSVSSPKFGLTMAKPLLNDTVSFKGIQQSVKTAGSRADSITFRTARILRSKLEKPHAKLKELLLSKFGGMFSTPDKPNLFTLLDRIKSEDSICQKTASRGWGNMGIKDLLTNMTDISGCCFILENKKSLNELIKGFVELIKENKIDIVEAEYHRLPPRYHKGNRVETFDSLDPYKLQRLKNAIIEHKNPAYQLWKDVDSMSGYSGLHLTIRNADGTFSEIQIMTRGMYNFKKVENLYYKIRNGKDIDPMYSYIEKFMEPLKPKNPDAMTEQEKAVQKAIRKYTQEAYEEMLSRPYDTKRKFLTVDNALSLNKKEKEMLRDYDFNKIGELMITCEKIAGK